jgi:hypothetical protein
MYFFLLPSAPFDSTGERFVFCVCDVIHNRVPLSPFIWFFFSSSFKEGHINRRENIKKKKNRMGSKKEKNTRGIPPSGFPAFSM